jgi:hypothetical protein
MTRNRAVIVTVAVLLLIMTPLTRKSQFLVTPSGRFPVVSAKFISGTNPTVSLDHPVKERVRNFLDRVGIKLQGSRGTKPFKPGAVVHAISILCRGGLSHEAMSEVEPECVNGDGQMIRLNHRMTLNDPGSGYVNVIWYYAESELSDLYERRLAGSEVTNFAPRQLLLFSKSDRAEMTRLNLKH